MNKFILIISFAFLSCTTHSNKLSEALETCGQNRAELEKVLSHYSKNEADSLKLRATKFLIENMPGHYTYGGKYLDSYVKKIDSLNPHLLYGSKMNLYSIPLRETTPSDELQIKYDIETITSDFLIRHINYKFELWESLPWRNDIRFQDFCEYLLPYRIDIEPIQYMCQDSLDNYLIRLKETIESMNECNPTMNNSRDYIKKRVIGNNHIHIGINLPNSAIKYMYQCEDLSYDLLEQFKLIGIPSMIDLIPHWANANGRHWWNNLVDTHELKTTVSYIQRSMIAKIYRKTFSHNESPTPDGNYIPNIFTPFIKDVTDQYIKTEKINLRYNGCTDKKVKNVYLSVFNELSWNVIAWSEIKGNDYALFEKMGTNIVYLPTYYVNNDEHIADYPFILESSGNIKKLVPDENNKTSILIHRKSPKEIYKLSWDENLIGAVVEASNHPKFNRVDTIAMITQKTNNSNYSIDFSNLDPYRYYRIIPEDNRQIIQLAEMSFFSENNNQVFGDFLIQEEGNSVDRTGNYPKDYLSEKSYINKVLTDNNLINFATIKGALTVDFKKPIRLSAINITLRNDGNYIYPNNTYELLYYDRNGWFSMGVKTASDYNIEFENVPFGALYWLKNLTEGREERIFTYEDGKMKFW